MRLKKLFLIFVCSSTLFIGCSSDDEEVEVIPPRDRGEQAIVDEEALMAYLETHFYNYEDFQNPSEDFDYKIRFDTIGGDNADKVPLIESDLLMARSMARGEVDYNYYVLKIREGAGDKPTFADSTFQDYRGELLNGISFDQTVNPVWFDHPGTMSQNNPGIAVVALTEGLTEFGEATDFTVNPDNTVSWSNDFGVGAVFVPSGLAYFNSPPPSIPAYSPLIFSFQLYVVNEADHDRDGIPSYLEDLDGDGNLFNDNTSENNAPNYLDPDDDRDGTPTRDEIIINGDGTIEFPDENNNGVPDYLDPDSFK